MIHPNAASQPHDDHAIRGWLIAWIMKMDGVDAASVDPAEPFSSYGLTSRHAIELSGDLEDWLGRPLSPALVYDYPTIDALARFLGGGA